MKYLVPLKSFLINEGAKQIDENIDVYIIDKGNTKNIIFFNKFKKEVIGFFCLERFKDNWQAKFTAAHEGYGPKLYDFGLMCAYPQKVVPSRWSSSIHDKGVWKYYFDNRNDVTKEPIRYGTNGYISAYEYGLEYLNCYYKMEPTNEYYNVIMRSDSQLSDDVLYSKGKRLYNDLFNIDD